MILTPSHDTENAQKSNYCVFFLLSEIIQDFEKVQNKLICVEKRETKNCSKRHNSQEYLMTYLAQLCWQDVSIIISIVIIAIALNVNFPCCFTIETFIGRITTPETLYKHCCRWNLTIKMLLSLLLLNFQCET